MLRKEDKQTLDLLAEREKEKKSPENKSRQRKIRRNMGTIMYFLFPFWRAYYDPSKDDEDIEKARLKKEKDEYLAALEKQKKIVSTSKNPESLAWKNYEKKNDNHDYIAKKHVQTEKYRVTRTEGRAERKAKRKNDNDLVHKFSK